MECLNTNCYYRSPLSNLDSNANYSLYTSNQGGLAYLNTDCYMNSIYINNINNLVSNYLSILEIIKAEENDTNSLLIKYKDIIFTDGRILPSKDSGLIFNFQEDIPSCYYKKDNYYWDNSLIVTFNSENDKRIAFSSIFGKRFSTLNNFDVNITNEEMRFYLDYIDKYKTLLHSLIENYIEENNIFDSSVRRQLHLCLENKIV